MSRHTFDKAIDRYYVSASIDGESSQYFFATEAEALIDAESLKNSTSYRVTNVCVVRIADEDLEEYATPATCCDAHYPLILDGYRLWCRLDAGHTGNHECETPDEAWSGSTYEWADQPECYTTF